MRVVRTLAVILAIVAASSNSARPRIRRESIRRAEAPGRSPAKLDGDVARLFRYEPTGLSLLRPYERGKIPVVFIHGLWANPWSWSRMIESLEADPALRDRYQFWTFGYSTGDPIPYSASLLRHNLDEVRRKFDPDGSDGAFDRMVLVGHSMGGLLTKMMVQESGTRLWQVISDRPVDELAGDPADRDLFRRALDLQATAGGPSRGLHRHAPPRQPARSGRTGAPWLAARSPPRPAPGVVQPAPRPQCTGLLQRQYFRKGLPTSVDELEWQSPFLMGLDATRTSLPTIEAHSIIADRRDPPRAGGTDGLVPYESAHLDGTASELLVSSGHLCQDNPAVIREVRRILIEHGVR